MILTNQSTLITVFADFVDKSTAAIYFQITPPALSSTFTSHRTSLDSNSNWVYGFILLVHILV